MSSVDQDDSTSEASMSVDFRKPALSLNLWLAPPLQVGRPTQLPPLSPSPRWLLIKGLLQLCPPSVSCCRGLLRIHKMEGFQRSRQGTKILLCPHFSGVGEGQTCDGRGVSVYIADYERPSTSEHEFGTASAAPLFRHQPHNLFFSECQSPEHLL